MKAHEEYATFVETRLPTLYNSNWYQRLCDIVKSENFETIVDLILILNAFIIACQDYPLLSGMDVTTDPKWESMETIFTVLYTIEAILKITVNGWKKYTESGRNLYDFTITVVAIIASAYVYCEFIFEFNFLTLVVCTPYSTLTDKHRPK